MSILVIFLKEYFVFWIFADFSYPQNTAEKKQPQKIPVIRYVEEAGQLSSNVNAI